MQTTTALLNKLKQNLQRNVSVLEFVFAAKFFLHCSPCQTTEPSKWQTPGSYQTLGGTPSPSPPPPRQTSVSCGVRTFRKTKTNVGCSVLDAGVVLSRRRPASGEQLEMLRLSYCHAGPGSGFSPETAGKQQPIAQQSDACFFPRMLMLGNLLLSAWCGQRFPSPHQVTAQAPPSLVTKRNTRSALKLARCETHSQYRALQWFICSRLSPLSLVTFLRWFLEDPSMWTRAITLHFRIKGQRSAWCQQ